MRRTEEDLRATGGVEEDLQATGGAEEDLRAPRGADKSYIYGRPSEPPHLAEDFAYSRYARFTSNSAGPALSRVA
jgi:hypothetical protein